MDKPGYKTFSNKVLVTGTDISLSASVFLNPAKSYVTVQGLPSNQITNLSIKDGNGNVLARGVSTGGTKYRSSLGNNMQPGTYYIIVSTTGKTETLKFIKE